MYNETYLEEVYNSVFNDELEKIAITLVELIPLMAGGAVVGGIAANKMTKNIKNKKGNVTLGALAGGAAGAVLPLLYVLS